jgi:hypothetical protein
LVADVSELPTEADFPQVDIDVEFKLRFPESSGRAQAGNGGGRPPPVYDSSFLNILTCGKLASAGNSDRIGGGAEPPRAEIQAQNETSLTPAVSPRPNRIPPFPEVVKS